MRDQWSKIRDSLLGNPRFHRLALRIPLVRSVARKRARAVFDLCSGFVYSQVLLACVRLGVLEFLQDGPRELALVSAHCGVGQTETERLLRAAIPLGLIELRSNERYGLGYLAAPLLANPGLLALIEHNALFFRDLADPVALLRAPDEPTELSRYWAYARAADPSALPSENVDDYSELMAISQAAIAEDLLAAYDFSRHRCLLDVGGGEGAFATAAATAHSNLQVMVADLPMVAGRADKRFVSAGIETRAQSWGGNFFADPLPTGADVATLIRVVHDHDDADVLALLRSVRAALPADGRLIVAEQMASTGGAETVGDTYFGLYLLAMGRGRPRSSEAIEALLVEAGFGGVEEIPTALPLQVRLLVARPRAGA